MAKFIANRKTSFGLDAKAEVSPIIESFLKVIETDMSPSLMIYFTTIGLGEFYAFAAVFGYFFFIASAVMVIAYMKKLYKLIIILRILIVLFTIGAFFNIFIDNMSFDS